MSAPVIIDRINLRLPKGWRGDPSRLARQVAEQLQQQAAQLQSAKRLDLQLRGPFAGVERRVAGALDQTLQAQRLQAATARSTARSESQ
jgi:hypothetical protein